MLSLKWPRLECYKIGGWISALIFVVSSLISCTTKKNTSFNRQWQAFTTKYNVYYNGDEHFRETLSEMEKNYEDDYSRRLLMHPAEAYTDSHYPQPSGDFTRTIEKMQKAIELHSISRKPARRSTSQKEREFRQREEFNPFLHNAWILMGMAQYYNGDFTGAASTFKYTSKHFSWLPEIVTLARLWEARSYATLGWSYETENILHLIKEKDLTNKHLRQLHDFVEADYLIHTNQFSQAIPFLQSVAESASGSQSQRLWFLLGQIQELTGNRQGAYYAFKRAAGGPSTPYRTKFNARIKQSEVFPGNNITKEVKSLKSMAKYQRNSEYLDQIYYAIGNLYLTRKDTFNATQNYMRAIEESQRQDLDMALASLALGNILFSQRKYTEAQPYYSKALPFLSDNYPGIKDIRKRSDVLDQLANYDSNILLQDSLLHLSSLPENQQVKIAENLVAELLKKEKKFQEEEELRNFETTADRSFNAYNEQILNFQTNNDNSWYFYNTYTKKAGITAFQRKWGSRKLEDDWRRKDKKTFSFEDSEINDKSAEMLSGEKDIKQNHGSQDILKTNSSDPHSIEYYLRQIPKTPEEIEIANNIIKESLYNMALILKDNLEDFPAAKHEFLRLQARYPENEYNLEVFYNLYIMASREGDKTEAEQWRQKILLEFPESSYALAMKDPNYFDNLRKMHETQEDLYEKAYDAYLNNNNETVHQLTEEIKKKYPLSPILPKFLFIDGLSYLTDGNPELFKERIREVLQLSREDDLTDIASSILKGLSKGRSLQASDDNYRSLVRNTKLSHSGEEKETESREIEFEYNPDTDQYLVLAFPLEIMNPNKLLFEVARFNFSTFLIKDFDLELMNFSGVGLLIIKGFRNLKEVENYRTIMEQSDIALNPDITPIMISKDNFEILLKEGGSFEDYFRFVEEKLNEE